MDKSCPDEKFLCELASAAGGIMRRDFRNPLLRPKIKSDRTPVLKTDEEINEMVINMTRVYYPNVEVLGEESERNVGGAKWKLAVDPVDGTIPFSLEEPISTFCAALIDNEMELPVLAVIYDPFLDRMWHCKRGGGTLLNKNKSVHVSWRNTVSGAQLGVFWREDTDFRLHEVEWKLKQLHATCSNPLAVAYFGGLLASGKIDGIIFPWKHIWEIAAIQLIAEGAGGEATDIHGKSLRYGPDNKVEGWIVSNGLIHDQLLDIVASCQNCQ